MLTLEEKTQTDLGKQVLKRRCLLKDQHGTVVETPEQMYWRVANAVAAIESKFDTSRQVLKLLPEIFYKMMSEGRFLPNSPTLMNAGKPEGMLSACFVLPVADSIPDIFETVKNTALIQKAGGGTGFSLDNLRPTGDRVASSGGTTSGPISFWRVIAETTHAIQQGAHRRGANMGMMNIHHPDIIKFIHAKRDSKAFENFNISVKIPDNFVQKLNNSPAALHTVINPRTGNPYVIPKSIDIHNYTIHDLIPPGRNTLNCYSVSDIWNMIITNAHNNGEPGVCFIDRVNEDNPTPALGNIMATNPCGEQPLLDFEACNLGSLNLTKFILPDNSDLDWKKLETTTANAVRFLDNVIDANNWPVPEIKEMSLGNRKIGLGIMGFADALLLLGIRYDSDLAVEFAEKVSRFIQTNAHKASRNLAGKRGKFPNWSGSIWDTQYHTPMRNAACTTIAPTGSISIIANCSSGIEPVFAPAYKRRALDGTEFIQIHPLLEQSGIEQGWLNDKAKTTLLAGTDLSDIPGIPPELAEVFVTAHQIEPQWHIKIQAAFQNNVDNAVSKTVNLPASAAKEDVDRVYRLAYDLNCKGITVYRDQSRQNQVLSSALQNDSKNMISTQPRMRGTVTTGRTRKFRMGCGTLFVTVNKDEHGLCEVFANLGKAGGCPSQSEATCRVVSAAIRCGVDPHVMIDQLRGIRCLSAAVARKTNKDIKVLSCPDAIAQALQEALELPHNSTNAPSKRICPECKKPLRLESGCDVCSCGYSKCG